MRNRFFSVLVCCALLAAAFAFNPAPRAAQAQGMVTCDSTLITLLYLAEHDYHFKSSMDISSVDTGQFKPLFDAMMAGGAMATEEPMMGTEEPMMGTAEAMMTLKPGVVAGENATCTSLRAEVETYLYGKLTSMMK